MRIDNTGPYPPNPSGTKYWMFAVDDFSYMSWIHFSQIKSDMTQFLKLLVELIKEKGSEMKMLRYYNDIEHMNNLREIFRK